MDGKTTEPALSWTVILKLTISIQIPRKSATKQ